MSAVGWMMELWQRFMYHDSAVPAPPPPAHLERDPDLDMVHLQQHDLMNRVTAAQLRKSMAEREAYQRILEKQANPWGIGRDESDDAG